MLSLSPVLHPIWIAGWLALTAGLAVMLYLRLRGHVAPLYISGLVALRIIFVLLLTLLLLQPFFYVREPDHDGFHLTLLADVSGSMRTADCSDQRKRIHVLADILRGEAGRRSMLDELEHQYTVRPFVFSDEREHLRDDVSILPGNTALGDVLRQSLTESTSAFPLGGVVLLSDGHKNRGASALETAQAFRREDIPVSCVGIGEKRSEADIRLRVAHEHPITTRAGNSVNIPVVVHSSFDEPVEIPVELSANGIVQDSTRVQLDKGPTEQEVQLQAVPERAGFYTYRIHTDSIAADKKPETDTAFAAVEATERPVYRVLYLGAYLTPEHKFLRMVAQNSENIQLSSVVKSGTSDDEFYRAIPDDSPLAEVSGFPAESATLNAFQAIILDTRTLPLLSADARNNLVDFVSRRGGGVLCTGPIEHLSPEFLKLLPVRETASRRSQGRVFMEFRPTPVFPEEAMSTLNAAPGPYLPQNRTARILKQMTRGARPVLVLPEDNLPLLAAQRYGGGRTAYLGTEATWRWHLVSADDKRRHTRFWHELMSWLSTGSKARLSAAFDGAKYGVHQTTRLEVDVAGQDFRPAMDADVTVDIEGPGEFAEQHRLSAAADMPGTYTTLFTPTAVGEYEIRVRAELPDEPDLTRTFHVLGVYKGTETEDTRFQEETLRDIARITGGRFVSYDNASALLDDLPLSNAVPVKEKRINWNDCWWFLIVLAVVPLVEWYLRRRIGLR